jgi:HAMP domain-containing protein
MEPEGADAEEDNNELGANLVKSGHKVALATSEGQTGSMIWAVPGHGERIHGYAATDGALGYPGLGWGVSVNLDLETAVQDILAAERQVMIAGLVLLILVAAAALAFARSIAKPVIQMAEVAAKLADGDVEQEVTHHSKDEVGQLADSFRNMVAYIKGASAAVAQIGSRPDARRDHAAVREGPALAGYPGRVRSDLVPGGPGHGCGLRVPSKATCRPACRWGSSRVTMPSWPPPPTRCWSR